MIFLRFSRPIRKLLRLSLAEQMLLVQAFGLLVAVRIALWLITFKRLQSLLSRVEVRGPRKLNSRAVPAERVARFVAAASRYVPRASCLTQALVADTLLRRAGHDAVLRVGVARQAGTDLRAHAWVECAGKVVIGRIKGFDEFQPLPPLQMASVRV
jgi:hypothetical protein